MREEQSTIADSWHELPAAALAGALAGLVATAPMTVAMELMHRELPWWQRYPLPPSQITDKVAQKLGLSKHMSGSQHTATTLVAHFVYGMTAGALYGPLARGIPAPAMIKGILAGLLVWSVSYLGLLPTLGILRPATRHPARRNVLMIAAHAVWGAVLGVLTEMIRPQQ